MHVLAQFVTECEAQANARFSKVIVTALEWFEDGFDAPTWQASAMVSNGNNDGSIQILGGQFDARWRGIFARVVYQISQDMFKCAAS